MLRWATATSCAPEAGASQICGMRKMHQRCQVGEQLMGARQSWVGSGHPPTPQYTPIHPPTPQYIPHAPLQEGHRGMARGTQRLSATRPHPMGMSMDEHWSLSFLWEPTRGSWGLDSLTWTHHTPQAVSPSLAQYFGFVYEGNAVGVAAPGAVTRYTSPKSIPFSEMNGALFRPHNIIIIPQQLRRAISPTETNPSGPGFVRARP